MDSRTLFTCLKYLLKGTSVRKSYVVAKDELYKVSFETFPIAIIMNTAKRNQPPGQHWVAFFVQKAGHSIQAIFFDSYMQTPSDYDLSFPYPIIYKRLHPLQSYGSNYCGLYSLYFLYHFSRGVNVESILSKFSMVTTDNDNKVLDFYRRIRMSKSNVGGQICCPRVNNVV